jgi:hypothetical protein
MAAATCRTRCSATPNACAKLLAQRRDRSRLRQPRDGARRAETLDDVLAPLRLSVAQLKAAGRYAEDVF